MTPLILIVDDNLINSRLLSMSLVADGYETSIAASAREALALLERTKPGLIVLDVQLPDGNGLALCRDLRRAGPHRDTPIIVVTAFAMKDDEERAMQAGCTRYLSKPIDVDLLSTLVGELLRSPGGGTSS